MAVVRAMSDEAAAAGQVSKQLAAARQEAEDTRARLGCDRCTCAASVRNERPLFAGCWRRSWRMLDRQQRWQ